MSKVLRADQVEADYECAICQEAYKEPVRLPCAHVFCAECVEAAVQIKRECPVCRAELRHGLRFEKAHDVARRMDAISVACPNKGCGTVVALSKLRAHQEKCRYGAVSESVAPAHMFHAPEGHRAPPPTQNRSTFTCPYCQMKNLPRKDLVDHVNSKHSRVPPSQRQVVCPICASMPVC